MTHGHGHSENPLAVESLLKGNRNDEKHEATLLRGVFEGGKDTVQVFRDMLVLAADKLHHTNAHERAEHYQKLMHDLNKVCQEHLFKDKHTHVIGVDLKKGEHGLMVEDAKGRVFRIDPTGHEHMIGSHDAHGKFVPVKEETRSQIDQTARTHLNHEQRHNQVHHRTEPPPPPDPKPIRG